MGGGIRQGLGEEKPGIRCPDQDWAKKKKGLCEAKVLDRSADRGEKGVPEKSAVFKENGVLATDEEGGSLDLIFLS